MTFCTRECPPDCLKEKLEMARRIEELEGKLLTKRSIHADYKCQNPECGNVFNVFMASTGCPKCDDEAVGHDVPQFSTNPPCGLCGGPYQFDTSIPSDQWNVLIRAAGLPDYLCANCILKAFVSKGESFTATLWGDSLNGNSINVCVVAHPNQSIGEQK